MVTLLIGAGLIILGIVVIAHDRRTLLSGLLPFLGLLTWLTGLTPVWLASTLFVIVLPLGILGEVLTHDGYWLLSRYGTSAKGYFFLVGGFLVMVFAPLFPVLWLLWRSVLIVKLMLAIYGYVAVLIDAYLLATVINALPLIIKPTKILILGAGLIKGGVGPVLRRRLLGGLALYQRFPKAELIMSGGQGDDEPEPEAVAMHRFARQKGVPESAIRLETNSTNTATNLSEAKRFINSGDRVVLVTSDYHLLRSLLYARRQGVNCQGLAVHTPHFTFTCNAFIRELGAYTTIHRYLIPLGLVLVIILCLI